MYYYTRTHTLLGMYECMYVCTHTHTHAHTLNARLPVVVVDIRGALAASQVDKGQLPTSRALPPKVDLQHGVRARRVHIGASRCRRSSFVTNSASCVSICTCVPVKKENRYKHIIYNHYTQRSRPP